MTAPGKAALAIGGALALALAWYLISPLWRTIVRDDASPLAVQQQAGPAPSLPDSTEQEPGAEKPALPAGPEILLQGALVPKAHEVKGKALVISHEGKRTLRFEDFETINGPDVRIYLSSALDDKDFVDLGSIKATKGNVNYDIPAGVDLAKYNKALVWCEDFSVLFSYAELR